MLVKACFCQKDRILETRARHWVWGAYLQPIKPFRPTSSLCQETSPAPSLCFHHPRPAVQSFSPFKVTPVRRFVDRHIRKGNKRKGVWCIRAPFCASRQHRNLDPHCPIWVTPSPHFAMSLPNTLCKSHIALVGHCMRRDGVTHLHGQAGRVIVASEAETSLAFGLIGCGGLAREGLWVSTVAGGLPWSQWSLEQQ
jgi:hypothetical protein